MSREDFLKKLESLLLDIDVAERKEALQYYEEYFADSERAEEDVIKELGSPEEVAHSIREELAEKEMVPTQDIFHESNQHNNYEQAKGQTEQSRSLRSAASGTKDNSGMEPWAVVLIILGIVFVGIPVGIPLLATAFGLLVVFFAFIFCMLLAALICAVVFGIVAILLFIFGIIKMFAVPLAGVILLGISLILLGLCFLFTLITWKVCEIVIPAMIRGIVYLCRLPFHGRKGAAA